MYTTLQDRLVKELRLRKIDNIEEANKFLPEFIEKYNAAYGVKAREREDGHAVVKEEIDFERIFAGRSSRKVAKDLSFSYQGVTYQIETESPHRFTRKYVAVLDRPGKPILVEKDGKSYAYKKWAENKLILKL